MGKGRVVLSFFFFFFVVFFCVGFGDRCFGGLRFYFSEMLLFSCGSLQFHKAAHNNINGLGNPRTRFA